MQKESNKTAKILLATETEIFDQLIIPNHPFRKLKQIINWTEIIDPLRDLYSDLGRTGFSIEKTFKALLVQFWEDYSDRQMEKALKENIAIKWFCGFGLTEATPDYSYFSRLRTRIGTNKLAAVFNSVNQQLQAQGLFGNVFTFVDASAIITKTALWEERDKAIKDGETKLNNAVVNQYAADKDAKWGAKSKDKIWFGYKRHCAVDMRYGLINKVAVTPANVLDFKMTENICPKQGMVFCDKLYDCKQANQAILGNNCFLATLKKNNNPLKNKGLDKWRSAIRMPFEGTFSKLRKRAKFRGLTKMTFQCFAEAMVHNLKKATTVMSAQVDADGSIIVAQ